MCLSTQVKIVSFLGAPGFCTVGTSGYHGDWSSAGVDGSVVLKLRINPRNFGKSSAQTLTYFAVQVCIFSLCFLPSVEGIINSQLIPILIFIFIYRLYIYIHHLYDDMNC